MMDDVTNAQVGAKIRERRETLKLSMRGGWQGETSRSLDRIGAGRSGRSAVCPGSRAVMLVTIL